MKQFKVFSVVVVAAIISSGMFNACKKENVVQNETLLSKQEKFCQNHFVLMTEAEKHYLIENGQSMNIDDFIPAARDIIRSRLDQIFVATVRNGNVYFMAIRYRGIIDCMNIL